MNNKNDRMKKLVKFQKNRKQREYAHRKKVEKRQSWPKSSERHGKAIKTLMSYEVDDSYPGMSNRNNRLRRYQ